jgi:MFS family permease
MSAQDAQAPRRHPRAFWPAFSPVARLRIGRHGADFGYPRQLFSIGAIIQRGAARPGYRWCILGVLFLVRFCLGFQFQSAGSLGPFLVDEFALDYLAIGTLIGLFMLPGLFIVVPGGMLGKRYGDKRIVIIGLCAMILGGGLSGVGASYSVVSLGRALSGAGGTLLAVLMTKMITDWFAERELFIGMSIFIIGWPVGIAAGQATQGQLAQAFGWEAVFYLTAAMLAVALVVMAALYHSAPGPTAKHATATSRLTGNEIWLVSIAGWIWMFLNSAYVIVLSFGPALMAERGASVIDAGRIVSLMSWVFMVALPLGGWLTTRFQAPNTVMAIGLVGSALFAMLVPVAGMPEIMFALFGTCFALATPAISALQAEALNPENRATGLGIYYLWYYAGLTVTPALAGVLTDATHGATASIELAAAMMLGCLCLLGLFRLEQSRRRLRVEDGGRHE